MSELQGRLWLSVRSTLLLHHALPSHEKNLRPKFVHSKSEPHMTKRVVVNVCARVKHAEGVLRGPGYVSEQFVCMVMRRDKATSRWHITEKCVCIGNAKRQKIRSGLFLDPQRPAQ